MEPRCSLCGKTVKELAEEELEGYSPSRKSLKITLSDEVAYPYLLCEACEELLRYAIPNILEDIGIIKFDEKKDRYILTTE